MFTDKKSKTSNSNQMAERNIIAKNTTFKGDIISEGDFRIDGSVEGTLKTTGRIIVGREGVIKGTTTCSNADVEGTISGNLNVEDLLTLKETASIQGDVTMDKLSVEPGAVFNVNCSMKGGVKSINHGKGKKSEKTA